MPSKQNRIILISLLVALGVMSLRLYSLGQERRRLATSYAQAQRTLSEMTHELSGMKEANRQAATELSNLQQELTTLQGRLDDTTQELTALQQEHEQLSQRNTSLTEQVSSLADEKHALETKLSSIKELKLAIRAVKQKMSAERWEGWRRRVAAKKAEDEMILAQGNRGLVVKNGTPTLGSVSRLHVRVLELETP